jgi:hypothetical protein
VGYACSETPEKREMGGTLRLVCKALALGHLAV